MGSCGHPEWISSIHMDVVRASLRIPIHSHQWSYISMYIFLSLYILVIYLYIHLLYIYIYTSTLCLQAFICTVDIQKWSCTCHGDNELSFYTFLWASYEVATKTIMGFLCFPRPFGPGFSLNSHRLPRVLQGSPADFNLFSSNRNPCIL